MKAVAGWRIVPLAALLLIGVPVVGVPMSDAPMSDTLAVAAPATAALSADMPPVVVKAADDAASPYVAHKLCDLADERINESSGLGASRRYPGCLWTHNDSGDTARVFLLAPTGQTLAEVSLIGADAVDWEDMAVVGAGNKAEVYMGDIGDDQKARASITVYRFQEADVPLAPNAVTKKSIPDPAPVYPVACDRLTLTYPDGPHDAETLIATPDGRLLVVTKDLNESLIFITPAAFDRRAKNTGQVPQNQVLRKIGALKFGGISLASHLTTGGDLSPDGKRLVIRTYTEAHEWKLAKPYDIGGDWWRAAPQSFYLPMTKQGEAICYDTDGRNLFLTSEKLPTPLIELSPG